MFTINLIKNTVKESNIMKSNLFYFNIFEIFSCGGKAGFSGSLIQSVSHDPSEIILIFDVQEKKIIKRLCCFI